VAGQGVQPDGDGERSDRDSILGGLRIDVTMERRKVEALVLELKLLAASYGLSVKAVEIESVTPKNRPRRSPGAS
jgi:hypothetical protein